jgi:hypothetical protein
MLCCQLCDRARDRSPGVLVLGSMEQAAFEGFTMVRTAYVRQYIGQRQVGHSLLGGIVAVTVYSRG